MHGAKLGTGNRRRSADQGRAGICMFYMNAHTNGSERVIAVCDSELVGKVFEEGEKCLDLKRYAAFYKGWRADGKRVLEELKNFSSVNIVGEKAVELAVGAGFAERGQVLRIANVPYVQAYRI